MKLSLYGRLAMALFASLALGLGMTACGGGTVGYLWILGQEAAGQPSGQIVGFKIDDFTGNLTQTARFSETTNGTYPVSLVVKNGGRYVYVINQGSAPTGGLGSAPNQGSGISIFAVGGDGSLTFENSTTSSGFDPIWAQMDNSGTYLFVLDKYSPESATTNVACLTAKPQNCYGSITVFSADPNTGRLTKIQNTQTIPQNGQPVTYFNVGTTPLMMSTEGSCLITLNSDNTISPYLIAGSTGQLSFTGPSTQKPVPTPGSLNSINGNGSLVFLTDVGTNTIYPFNLTTSNCNLAIANGGGLPNYDQATTPVYTIVDSSNKYLYVLNQSSTTTAQGTPFSSITGFNLVPGQNGQLQQMINGQFTTGAGPVCMVEDPTHKYMYVSNHNDGTVTGKVFDPNTGQLSALTRGSTFAATGQATCLVVSGAVD